MGLLPEGQMRAKVAELTGNGCTPRDIALRLNISTQAVYQHLQIIRRERETRKSSRKKAATA